MAPAPLLEGILQMADLSVTAANVIKGSGASVITGTAGATVTAGQTVYLDSSTSTYKLAKADASATSTPAAGIALNGAANGQPLSVLTAGNINPGATATVGQVYVVSAAVAGNIAPYADLASGNYVAILGVATTASNIFVNMSGSSNIVAKP